MAITDIGYRIIDGVDALGTQMSDTVFGAPIKLGVTGLARSGKTVLSGSLLSRLSRRFGEGMVNAALAARVGRATIDVCRPLPFNMQERPKISVVLRRALTGIFDKTPD